MSKVFCDKPFNHNYIHTNGKMRLCCVTDQDIPTDNNYNLFDANKHSVEDYWNSNRMKEIRRRIVAGKKVRDCERCYMQEEKGVFSLRMASQNNMETYLKQVSADGSNPQKLCKYN